MPMDFGTTPASNPLDRPVRWAEAKAHLRLDSDDLQTLVESLIDAATRYAEDAMECSLMAQERTKTFFTTAASHPLPRGPLISITSITDDADVAVTDFRMQKVGHSDRVIIDQAGVTYPITIVYQAGYASAALISPMTRLCILQHVATMFVTPGSTSEKALSVVPHSLQDYYRMQRRNPGVA